MLRELERQRVAGELRRVRLGERLPDRDRALLDRRQDRAPPCLLQLLELDARSARSGVGARPARAGSASLCEPGSRAPARARRLRAGVPCSSRSRRNASDSRERSAAGRVTLTSASSSGRRGSPPWRMSSTATASRSISRTTVAARQLVRLLAQPLARLVGHGQRVRHLVHVLHEQQVAEVLEQVGDEPAEILAPARRAPRGTAARRRCRCRRPCRRAGTAPRPRPRRAAAARPAP